MAFHIRPRIFARHCDWLARRFGIAVLSCMAVLPFFSHAHDTNARTILLLNPPEALSPSAQAVDQAILHAFERAAPSTIVLSEQIVPHSEPPSEWESDMLALLEKKYRNRHIDLILARGDHALDFFERHGNRLWPSKPAMFFAISDASALFHHRPASHSGVFFGHDYAGNLEMVKRLQPAVKHVVQILDISNHTERQALHEELSATAAKFGLTAETLATQPMADLLERLRHIPDQSALLVTSIDKEYEGRPQSPGNIVQLLSSEADFPLYGMRNSFIGNGAVGGRTIDLNMHGQQVAELALNLMNTPDMPNITRVTRQFVCTVDERQLKRWDMNFRALSSDCNRLFYVPAFWEKNGKLITISFGMICIVLTLLLLLHMQRRRRLLADEEAQRHQATLAHVARLGSVGELTASIVHEINQPLGAILANADAAALMLNRGSHENNELKAILADIREDDLRVSRIIQKLRTLLSKKSLESKPLSINDVVESCRSLLGNLAIRHHVTLQIHLQENLPFVSGDTTHLQQVLINLASNGIDAMEELPPDQRILRIRTETDEIGQVILTVSDFGAGIATDALPKIFDSFFTTKADGMGMGLAIVKTIVEMHHGTIEASNSPYGGAIFRVTIPAL